MNSMATSGTCVGTGLCPPAKQTDFNGMAAIRCLSLGPVDGISAEYPVKIVRGIASNFESIKREAIEIVEAAELGGSRFAGNGQVAQVSPATANLVMR